jgi:hypothetical protein
MNTNDANMPHRQGDAPEDESLTYVRDQLGYESMMVAAMGNGKATIP